MNSAPDGQKLFEPSFNLAALSSSKYKESPLLEEFKTDPPPTEEVKRKINFQAIREREREDTFAFGRLLQRGQNLAELRV